MKKLLSSIIGGTLGLALAAGVGISLAVNNRTEFKEAKAANTATLTFTAKCNGSGKDDEYHNWTVTSDASESTYDDTKGIHYGTSSAAISYLYVTTSEINGTVSQIVVNASGASQTSAKLNVKVNGSAFGSQKSLTSSNAAYTLTGSASGEIRIELTQSSTKKALYVKSIAVTYTVPAPTHAGTEADPYTVADARSAISNNLTTTGVYTSGKISRITNYNGTHHSITYWISDDGTQSNELEVYGGKGLNNANFNSREDILVGAAVVVYGNIKKYNSTYEYEENNYMTYYNADGIDIPDYTPEPAITTRTLAEFIGGNNTKAVAYLVTAQIKNFKNGSTKDEYGNMTLTDGTNDLIIYGSTMHTSALVWDSIAGEYTFSNPKKFMTDTYTNNLAVGNTITMILIRCDYGTTVEGCGVIILSCSGYAKIFLQSMTCDATGATAPTFSRTWQDLTDMFNALPEAEQGELTGATADPSGNVITQAVARYDMVVGKYGYTDFMGRNPASGANRMTMVVNNNTATIIIIAVVISASALAAFFILRKKKEA